MNKKLIILAIILSWSLPLLAQVERQAIENIWKGKWEKAFYQLDRAVNKDTLNITSAFAWAIYYSAPNNPDYSLDSASRYVRTSIVLFGHASEKQREKLRRFPLDSAIIIRQRDEIDSAAFAVARANGGADDYQRFIDIHPGAILELDAIAARDERAFQDAVANNTHEAFRAYLMRYPQSDRIADARANYERLLYQEYTRGRDLAGYERFLREHPGTSFEKEAERNVFEILTADGSIGAFVRFLRRPGPYHKRASDILFHLQLRNAERPGVESLWNDSIKAVLRATPPYVVPFFTSGKFGFMDPDGRTVLEAMGATLHDDYLCGNITENYVELDSSLVALNGATIFAGPVTETEDIGMGMVLVRQKTCSRLVHKSGWVVISECIDQARIVGGRFLAVQREDHWQLFSFSGRLLMNQAWDDITAVNQIVMLESGGEIFACTPERISAFAATPSGTEPFVLVDKISRWSPAHTWIRSGETEILLNEKSDTIAVAIGGKLSPARFGLVIRYDSGSHTVNWNGEHSQRFRSVLVWNRKAVVQNAGGWQVFDPVQRTYGSTVYDSLWLTGSFALATRRDSVFIHFPEGTLQKFKGRQMTTLIQGPDSTSFLLVDGGNAKPARLYDRDGKLVCQVPYDKIQVIGKGYFRVTKGVKFGILGSDGKLVVPVVMDAVGTLNGISVSVLKDGRFGLFNVLTRKLMIPQFPTNLVPYGKRYVVAQKNGLSGIITWENKPVTKFEFDEVKFWNDSAALVRRDNRWTLLNLLTNAVLIDQIRDFRFIREGERDRLAIVHAGDDFGVLHSNKGTIIPLKFTDIINVGSAAHPMYFTEKHIEEAAMYVVIYYDQEGKFLRREAYNSDDYERIYCPNN